MKKEVLEDYMYSILCRCEVIINNMEILIYSYRSQRHVMKSVMKAFFNAISELWAIVGENIAIFESYFPGKKSALLEAMKGVSAAMEREDYLYFSDYCEFVMKQNLCEILDIILSQRLITEYPLERQYKNMTSNLEELGLRNVELAQYLYHIFSDHHYMKYPYEIGKSANFFYRMDNGEKERLLTSANSHYKEAALFYGEIWNEQIEKYLFCGIGCIELYIYMNCISYEDVFPAEIEIYESDINYIMTLMSYDGCIDLLRNKKIKLIYDKGYQLLLERIFKKNDKEKVVLNYNSWSFLEGNNYTESIILAAAHDSQTIEPLQFLPFVEKIHNVADEEYLKLLERSWILNDFVYCCRVNRFEQVRENVSSIGLLLAEELPLEVYKDYLKLERARDYIGIADFIENTINPLFQMRMFRYTKLVTIYTEEIVYRNNMRRLKHVDKFLYKAISGHIIQKEADYILEYALNGMITVSVAMADHKVYYLHSIGNPQEEARAFVRRQYAEGIAVYHVVGLGLGYHIVEMARQYKKAQMIVYETNMDIIKMAFQFNPFLCLAIKDNIRIKYVKCLKEIIEIKQGVLKDSQREKVIIYEPSLHMMKKEKGYEEIKALCQMEKAMEAAYPLLKSNFAFNIKYCKNVADVLENDFIGKTSIIVAAGPSLDKNLSLLRHVDRSKVIILAAGTVLRKMVRMNIRPDYFVILDPNPQVYSQIKGYEDLNIPMIILSSAYKGVAQCYKAQKYIAFQQDFDIAEEYAEKNNYHLYSTGGSVTTLALDLAIHLKVKRVIFIGLDLAYTDNLGHASDTGLREKKEHREYDKVVASTGGIVNTSKVFNQFRRWIEERIALEKECEFIDATEGGALIYGTKIMSMKEVLEYLETEGKELDV